MIIWKLEAFKAKSQTTTNWL